MNQQLFSQAIIYAFSQTIFNESKYNAYQKKPIKLLTLEELQALLKEHSFHETTPLMNYLKKAYPIIMGDKVVLDEKTYQTFVSELNLQVFQTYCNYFLIKNAFQKLVHQATDLSIFPDYTERLDEYYQGLGNIFDFLNPNSSESMVLEFSNDLINHIDELKQSYQNLKDDMVNFFDELDQVIGNILEPDLLLWTATFKVFLETDLNAIFNRSLFPAFYDLELVHQVMLVNNFETF